MIRITVILSLFLLDACEPDPNPVFEEKANIRIELTLMNDTQRVLLHDTVALADEYDFYLSLFRLYLSKVRFLNENGEEVPLKDIALLDPGSNTANSFTGSIPEGNYHELRVGFGVDHEQNNLDPASFENSHPLSSYQSMYWTMLKYRFAKFEGKASSRLNSNDNIFVSYHPGTDEAYHTRNFPIDFSPAVGSNTTIRLVLDINEILDGPGGKIDFATEATTHSMPSDIQIAKKFMENLAASADLIVSPVN